MILKQVLCALAQALFLDIPHVLDNAWRRLEFRLGSECKFDATVPKTPTSCDFWRKPSFWFFVIIIFYLLYGPSVRGLCSLGPPAILILLKTIFGILFLLVSLVLMLKYFCRWTTNNISPYFKYVKLRSTPKEISRVPCREFITCVVFGVLLFFLEVILVNLMLGLLGLRLGELKLGEWTGSKPILPLLSETSCHQQAPTVEIIWIAYAQLLIGISAIGIFAFISSCSKLSLWVVAWAQFLIVLVVCLLEWFWLSTPITSETAVRELRVEASQLPYHHVLILIAPFVFLVIAAAPFISKFAFKGTAVQKPQPFPKLLADTELFIKREDPKLSRRRIMNALVYGPGYHIVHLLFFPSLAAFIAPPDSLYLWSRFVFAFTFFICVWSDLSPRWHKAFAIIERLFLSGWALVISLIIILIAILRWLKFDYVSTIMDVIPFATIFGVVTFGYTLIWLLEYWTNRFVAIELLNILSPGGVCDEAYIPYPRSLQDFDQRNNVARQRRFLASHGIGRFMALGCGTGPVNKVTTFNSFGLEELFRKLVETAAKPKNKSNSTAKNSRINRGSLDSAVDDVFRRAGSYFIFINTCMLLLFGFFLGHIWWKANITFLDAEPVVEAKLDGGDAGTVNLAALLARQARENRTAIVVAASGGGTRAALYTAHVLRGLHDLGLDRDVVLMSGVSGGGVALSYYAAHREMLTGAPASYLGPTSCEIKLSQLDVESRWDDFQHKMTLPFIQDVLDGAVEWRIFQDTPLSKLLAESFERRLFPCKPTIGSIKDSVLILNTAVAGHPVEDSELLRYMIRPTSNHTEAERPYQQLNGGRLLFTNLRDACAFPEMSCDEARHLLPDVRLPYRLVRDPYTSLASAAALNANFPPLFPNARVRLSGLDGDVARSYYVTDGGAQENLGLVSALFALKSALQEFQPKHALEGQKRPIIHFVIIEASALTYDFSQDRGYSTMTNGSRERMTGGLTNELIKDLETPLCPPVQSGVAREHCVHFHFLPLPLAFRARGGFGTHWLYAKKYTLKDPRQRKLPSKLESLWGEQIDTAVVDQDAIKRLWTALHRPEPGYFCAHKPEAEDEVRVQSWICGDSLGGPDLHIDAWDELIQSTRARTEPETTAKPNATTVVGEKHKVDERRRGRR